MLEALNNDLLRSRVALEPDASGKVAIAPLAAAIRTAVQYWRSPARARVSAYYHRQLAAAAYEEESARERVREVIDALIDIGDLVSVRVDGRMSLVLSEPVFVSVSAAEGVLLGSAALKQQSSGEPWRYARAASAPSAGASIVGFADWLGPAAFRTHLRRRGGGSGSGTIREYWTTLAAALRHEGQPIDLAKVRALTAPADEKKSYFGRHNLPAIEGRWSQGAPDGSWCGIRPGRNANEWHPILLEVAGSEARALDLFDWDEWAWALLARGSAIGPEERSSWEEDVLAFDYPVPAQFVKALRLLGGPAGRGWRWRLSEASKNAFETWRRSEF
jgi:hypothetical protein